MTSFPELNIESRPAHRSVIIGTPQAAGGAVLEVHTLIAVIIYALVALLLVRGAWLMFGEGRSASVARTDTVHTRVR